MSSPLPAVDWPKLEHAYGPAGDVPELWRYFIEHNDEDGRFSNAICHQGTVYSATRELLPALIAEACSSSPRQWVALAVVGGILGGIGQLGYKQMLSERGSMRNPFKKGEMMTFDAPDARELAVERRWVQEMKSGIEAHLDDWETMLQASPSPRIYQALAYLFKAYGQHSDSPRLHTLATQMIKHMETYDFRLSLREEG